MHNRLHVLEHMMLTFYKHYISFPVGANSGALEGQVVPAIKKIDKIGGLVREYYDR